MKKIERAHIQKWIITHHAILILSVILLIGAFLRLYDFTDLLRFNNDQVRDIKIVNAMIADHDFPLLGPKAGGTTFHLGPAFYYMMYLSALIFGISPSGVALFVPILGIASIALFYVIMKKYFATQFALVLTLLYATSFYVIKYSRFAWNPNVIPFFLFAFMLILLKTLDRTKQISKWWFCALGMIMGIGMQLHTTLLIIMPVCTLLSHGYRYIQTKRFVLIGLMITCMITLILLSPMIISDMQNNGENLHAFLSGSETKNAKRDSLINNVFLDGQLYVQSTIYILTGYEPTTNWIHMRKLFIEQRYFEILLAGMSFLFFALCCVSIVLHYKNAFSVVQEKIDLHKVLIGSSIFCFAIFLPIAHEINTRFFIILVFLPYLLIGAIFYMIHLKTPRLVSTMIITLCTILLIGSNLYTYNHAFDLRNTTVSSDLYGGISIAELHAHIAYMAERTTEPKIYMLPHAYGQSFRYIAAQDSHILTTQSIGKIPAHTNVFFLSDKPHKKTLSKSLAHCFTIIDSQHIGRFRTFTLQKSTDSCE